MMSGWERFVQSFLPEESAVADAGALPGCSICRLAADAFDAFYARLTIPDELPDVAAALARSHGFCPAHGREALRRLPRPVLARLLEPALAARRQAVEQLVAAASRPPADLAGRRAVRAAQAALAARAACPACLVEAAVVRAGLERLLSALGRPDGRAAYRGSDGLCVRHTRRALARASADSAPLLVEQLAAPLDSLLADVELYYHKETWEFSHEPRGAEQQAWRRGIERWAGSRRAARGSGA